MRDYKSNAPWHRETDTELDVYDKEYSIIKHCITWIALIGAVMLIAHSCVNGVVQQTEIDEAETRGRMLLMQQVMDEMERTGEDYRYFFTYASKPQSTGLYHAVLMRGAECRQ